MKILNSLPTDKAFFDSYAPLAASVTAAGFFAQVVSALTEVGIIYTGTAQSLAPLGIGHAGTIAALLVAVIATAVIEVGLRKTAPVAIDSILYRRWQGLHRPISIFVWLLAVVLLVTSGWLSFANSSVIVDNFTAAPTEQTTTTADSAYQAATATHRATYTADSTTIAATYTTRIQAATAAHDAAIQATRTASAAIRSKEERTGKSFATEYAAATQKQADQQAARATEIATLEAEKANELAAIRATYRAATEQADSDRRTATGEVKTANQTAAQERAATVAGYGSGLGWFTVVCLFIFAVSVILDRVYRKGAGIAESVQIEGYDFRPGALIEAIAAIRERVAYWAHSKITAFADKTPAAPLPSQPAAVYDLVEALQHVRLKLELDETDPDRTIYLSAKEPKEQPAPTAPRRIGYNRDNEASTTEGATTNAVNPLYATNHEHRNHETTNVQPRTTATGTATSEARTAYQTPDLRHALQELKKYKKRHGSHTQQAIVQERKGKVCKRTTDAVQNNAQWVAHWEQVVNQLTTTKTTGQ